MPLLVLVLLSNFLNNTYPLYKMCFFQIFFSQNACLQLDLNESAKHVRIGFADHDWKIKLKFVDGKALFIKNWFQLADCAKTVSGDMLVLFKDSPAFKFKVCVFDRQIVSGDSILEVSSWSSQNI